MSENRIGFIGLGIMGRPMALNLAQAGYPLLVYNRTRSRADEMASDEIQVADSPAAVAEGCDLVITIVSDNPAVEKVIGGSSGILEQVREGAVVVDMSTVSPSLEKDLNARLEKKGATLVDAPVSGGDVGAQKGTLAIMAGGRREDFERVKPLFEVMGETITYCGPVGNGQSTKLCNQILVSLNLLAVAETITFARNSGLDPEVMIEAVKGGAAGSWQLSNLGPKIAVGDYAPGFMIDLMQKDLDLVLKAGSGSGTALIGASLVHQLFNGAQSRGLGREGTQALMQVVESISNLS